MTSTYSWTWFGDAKKEQVSSLVLSDGVVRVGTRGSRTHIQLGGTSLTLTRTHKPCFRVPSATSDMPRVIRHTVHPTIQWKIFTRGARVDRLATVWGGGFFPGTQVQVLAENRQRMRLIFFSPLNQTASETAPSSVRNVSHLQSCAMGDGAGCLCQLSSSRHETGRVMRCSR